MGHARNIIANECNERCRLNVEAKRGRDVSEAEAAFAGFLEGCDRMLDMGIAFGTDVQV